MRELEVTAGTRPDPDLRPVGRFAENLAVAGAADLAALIGQVVDASADGRNAARAAANATRAATVACSFVEQARRTGTGAGDAAELCPDGSGALEGIEPISLRPQGGISREVLTYVAGVGGTFERGAGFFADSAAAAFLGVVGLAELGASTARRASGAPELTVARRVQQAAAQTWGIRWRHGLFDACFRLATGWPVPLQRIQAPQVYLDAYTFYRSAATPGEPETGAAGPGAASWTFALTSGLIHPLERLGSGAFARSFPSVDARLIAAEADNPFRRANFEEGILNRRIPGTRYYQYDEGATARALARWHGALGDGADRARYREIAADLLADALDRPNIELSAARRFTWVKSRLTRTSRVEQLVSFRHPTLRKIARAVHFSRRGLSARLDRNYLAAIAGATGAGALAVPLSPVIWFVLAVYGASARVLREYLNALSPLQVEARYRLETEAGPFDREASTEGEVGVRVLKRVGERRDRRFADQVVDELLRAGGAG